MHNLLSDGSAVAVAGRICVMGLDILDTVEYYNPTADVWTRVPSRSVPRSGLKSVVQGEDVYVIGGFDGVQRLGSARSLDVHMGRWTLLRSMAFPRKNFAAMLLDGSIYAAGGLNGSTSVSRVEVYDIEARQWHRATDLGIRCSAAACYVLHNVPKDKASVSAA